MFTRQLIGSIFSLTKSEETIVFVVLEFTFSFSTKMIITLVPQIVSALEEFPPLNSFRSKKLNLLGKKFKFAAIILISYFFQIEKRVVSAETICGNTVVIYLAYKSASPLLTFRTMLTPKQLPEQVTL